MNVAIIGCGYVGKAIAHYWRYKLGLVVTATTTTPKRVTTLEAVAQKVAVVKGDDSASLLSVLRGQETILLSVGAKNGSVYEEAYLQTAKTLVSLLPQVPEVRQLIYTGTYSVYGDRNGEWVDESSAVAPANANGEILSQTEQVLLSASNDDLKVCVLRLGGIYGSGRELVKIFGRVAGTTRPGDGSDITNWIHLEDIVGAIELVRSQQLQGIYNLVNDAYLTRSKLLERMCEQHQLPHVIWNASVKSDRPYNARVSNQKIKDAGYQFIHPQMSF